MKLNKHYWKRVAKSLNQWIEADQDYSRHLLIEHTGFFPKHVGDRGLNHDESKLLDFGTRLIEAKAIYFAGGASSYFTKIYIQSTVHSQSAGTYLELRVKGETYEVALYDRDEKYSGLLERAIGPLHEFLSEEYKQFAEYEREQAKTVDIKDGKRVALTDWDLQRRFKEEYYEEVTNLFQPYRQVEFIERLVKAGIKVLVFFRFTHQISANLEHHHFDGGIKTDYVREFKTGVELGWQSVGTYNSLPYTVRIAKSTKLPVIKLQDLGIEGKGYYSHDQRCSIPVHQVEQAKRFYGNFKRRVG